MPNALPADERSLPQLCDPVAGLLSPETSVATAALTPLSPLLAAGRRPSMLSLLWLHSQPLNLLKLFFLLPFVANFEKSLPSAALEPPHQPLPSLLWPAPSEPSRSSPPPYVSRLR